MLSRYMQPVGPLQRLPRCRCHGGSIFAYPFFQDCSTAEPVMVGSPCLRPPNRAEELCNKETEMARERQKKKVHFWIGSVLPHFPRSRCPPPPATKFPAEEPRKAIFPTLVCLKNVKIAGAVLLSPDMSLTDGATGPLFWHNLQILFYITRAWPAHSRHVATRRYLDWRSFALQNQQSNLVKLLRYDPNDP